MIKISIREEYVVTVGQIKWGSRESFREALELYEDAKHFNADCYVTLKKVTEQTFKSEYIPIGDYED